MDLIVWRHADAEDGKPDLERELTSKGRKQAARVADWLRVRLPKDFQLVSSPAARARQTAQALSKDLRIDRTLAPGASVAAVLKAAGWPDGRGTVVLVGHQPDLGAAIAHIVAGRGGDLRLPKGAFWWIGNDGGVVVHAVLSPDLLED